MAAEEEGRLDGVPQEPEYVEDTVLGRLITNKDWEKAASRMRDTDAGKAEAKKPSRNGGYLCHQQHFLEEATFSCIHLFGEIFPEALSTPSPSRHPCQTLEYPIHTAAKIASPKDSTLLLHLYGFAPTTVRCREGHGLLPLHIACKEGNTNAIQLLLELNRDASKDFNNIYGYLPLHFACEKNVCVSSLLKAYPDGAKQSCEGDIGLGLGNCLPIKLLLTSFLDYSGVSDVPNESLETFDLLQNAYRLGLKVKDEYGKLPLHWAAEYLAEFPQVMELLLSHDPEAAKDVSPRDGLPIKIMVQRYHEWDKKKLKSLQLLVEANPDAIVGIVEETTGDTLLHCVASQFSPSADVFQLFLDHHPEAANIKNKNGELPIHKLLQGFKWINPPTAFSTLITATSLEYVREKDKSGDSLFHVWLSHCSVWDQKLIPVSQTDCHRFCDEWQSAILTHLVGPCIECLFMKNGMGQAPLEMIDEEFPFIFPKLFKRMVEADKGASLFSPKSVSFERDRSGFHIIQGMSNIAPVTRILTALAKGDAYDWTPEGWYHPRQRRNVALVSSTICDSILFCTGHRVPAKKTREHSTMDPDGKLAGELRLVCCASSCMSTKDFGTMLQALLHQPYIYKSYDRHRSLVQLTDMNGFDCTLLQCLCNAHVFSSLDESIKLQSIEQCDSNFGDEAYGSHLHMFFAIVADKYSGPSANILYKRMVRTKNRKGQLPLHLVLLRKSKLNKLAHTTLLLSKDREAAWDIDPTERMYPFMLAALGEHSSLTCTYNLFHILFEKHEMNWHDPK